MRLILSDDYFKKGAANKNIAIAIHIRLIIKAFISEYLNQDECSA